MSKINAIRLINLNYNNNAIRISDETFQLNGESTLLSLRNGGGKSVLVQMIMAPFVHRRYQNTKDRPFSGYFTTNKPTFILVEWKLDQGAGYVLTGMMVRKNQEISEERVDELEVIQFIAEYKERCEQDIYHLPVVEKTKKDVTLKGFHACRQLFETYKRERSIPFFYYDMNNSAQSKQYFDKLSEYQIHYKEWEAIIKKINLKESGLSDLFADCKDEKGLVEKWFLEAVESKLNRDKNRMKEFQSILEKYVGQYKDNKSKIERRDKINAFEMRAERIMGSAAAYREASEEVTRQEGRIADFIGQIRRLNEREKENVEAAEERISEMVRGLSHLEYEKISKEIYQVEERERFCLSNLEMLQMEEDDLQREREKILRQLHMLSCAKQREEVLECKQERDKENQRLQLCLQKEENLEPERNRLGACLKQYYAVLRQETEREMGSSTDALREMESEKAGEEARLLELRIQDGKLSEQAGALGAKVKSFDEEEERFNRAYQADWHRNILGEYEAGELQIGQAEYEKERDKTEHEKTVLKNETEQYKVQRKSLQRRIEDETAAKIRLEAEKKEKEKLRLEYEAELSERNIILQYFGLTQEERFETEKILSTAERKLSETDQIRQGLEKEADALEKEYRKLAQGQVMELSEEFAELLAEAGIHFVYGMEWLKKNHYTTEKNKELVAKHPFLPYALILSGQELERLKGLGEQVYTSFPVPMIVREELEQGGEQDRGAVRSFAGLSFYVWFNDNLLEEEKLRQMLEEKAGRIRKLQQSIEQKKQEYTEYIGKREKIRSQKVTKAAYEGVIGEIETLGRELSAAEQEILKKREEQETLEALQAKREQRQVQLEQELAYQNRRLLDFADLSVSYAVYQENSRLLEKNRKEKERIAAQQKLIAAKISKMEQELVTVQNHLLSVERELEMCAEKEIRYQQYQAELCEIPEYPHFTAEWAKQAESRYEVITNGIGAEQRELEERVQGAEKRFAKAEEEWKRLEEKYHLSEEDYGSLSYDRKEETHQEVLLEDQERKLTKKKKMIHDEEIKRALIKQEKESKFTELRERAARRSLSRKPISGRLILRKRSGRWNMKKARRRKKKSGF